MYSRLFKRLLDLVASIIGFVVLSPIFFVVMILLFIANGGTPFFVQKRPGRASVIFHILKFRTMNSRRDSEGVLLSDEKRLTKIGKIVRGLSLDEIPQLLNVIKGDMSLVGPRPLLVEYLPLYNKRQKKRHIVRPGITGWAQVNGRNAISWEQKFEYDVWYVENISFFVDIKILLMTIRKVFKREGITSQSSVTMERFQGSK